MTKQELIDATRKAIELDDVKFNIISIDTPQSWGVEIIINNIVIILNAIIQDDDPETSIKLAYKNDRFLNSGKVFNIPVKNETIEYSLYTELVNTINKKIMRTEDSVLQELKSLFRENTITNILS